MTRPSFAWSKAVIAAACCTTIALSIAWRYVGCDGQAWRSAINSDGVGYHAYLTGIFIDGGLRKARTEPYHFAGEGDARVLKYFSGTALLQAPFFLLAHGIAWIASAPMDGRSLPYQLAAGMSALFFLGFGLWCVRKLLLSLAVSEAWTALALAIIAFGTGLIYCAVMTPAMSHVFSFAMVAWALAGARSAWLRPNGRALAPAALALGLAGLVRPTNLLVILALPIVALGTGRPFVAWVRSFSTWRWALALAVFAAMLGIQPLLWYLQSGHAIITPYSGEGFLWNRPMVFSSLFGARKGLFFYWPLLLVAAPGIVLILRRSPAIGLCLLTWFVAFVYVTGSWWIWYYGHSYGMRPYLDVLAVLAVPIAIALQALPGSAIRWVTAASVPLMLLQSFQTWQFHVGIIHPFAMDREKYGLIFLRGGERWRGLFSDADMAPPYAPDGLTVIAERTLVHADAPITLDDTPGSSPVFSIGPDVLPDDRLLYLEASLRRRALDHGASDRAVLVCTFRDGDRDRHRQEAPLNGIRTLDDRVRRRWSYAITLPPAMHGEAFNCHLQLNGGGSVLIDDFHVRLSAPR